MLIWGIVGNSHDASVAIFNKNTYDTLECLWAGLSKDFSGIEHDPHLNDKMSVSYTHLTLPTKRIV